MRGTNELPRTGSLGLGAHETDSVKEKQGRTRPRATSTTACASPRRREQEAEEEEEEAGSPSCALFLPFVRSLALSMHSASGSAISAIAQSTPSSSRAGFPSLATFSSWLASSPRFLQLLSGAKTLSLAHLASCACLAGLTMALHSWKGARRPRRRAHGPRPPSTTKSSLSQRPIC